VHTLPGTNIIITETFLNRLSQQPYGVIQLGQTHLKGQAQPTSLYLKTSDLVSSEHLHEFKKLFVRLAS
jgi:hypothetical protein